MSFFFLHLSSSLSFIHLCFGVITHYFFKYFLFSLFLVEFQLHVCWTNTFPCRSLDVLFLSLPLPTGVHFGELLLTYLQFSLSLAVWQAWRHYSPVTVHFQISIRFLQPISAPLTQLTCPLCISFRAFNTLITQLNSVSGSPTAVSFLSPVPDCFVCWLGGWGGVLFLHLSMACFVLPKARYFVQDSRNWSKWI